MLPFFSLWVFCCFCCVGWLVGWCTRSQPPPLTRMQQRKQQTRPNTAMTGRGSENVVRSGGSSDDEEEGDGSPHDCSQQSFNQLSKRQNTDTAIFVFAALLLYTHAWTLRAHTLVPASAIDTATTQTRAQHNNNTNEQIIEQSLETCAQTHSSTT
mmetsp:Transcript_17077/g.47979  ORF Transcript_17077/g.47979 Transcript_17077/m.47979 type:complete len:155 (+) Transcript_17077:2580-3044(+)